MINEILKKSFSEADEKTLKAVEKNLNEYIGKNYVPNETYKDKVLEINDLKIENAKIKDLELERDSYKSKYDTLGTEFNTYKTNISNEKIINEKKQHLKQALEKEKVNPLIIDLLQDKFDMSKIEIDTEKSEIKDWNNVLSPIKTQYAGLFGTVEEKQFTPANPLQTTANSVSSGTMNDFLLSALKR